MAINSRRFSIMGAERFHDKYQDLPPAIKVALCAGHIRKRHYVFVRCWYGYRFARHSC